ncbi:MAG: inositol monophosphatase family protein [Candidatus Curtissbacteria bacterium]|nr:inositol monophosphatase family protein [Candidatus Curtissbacteria bacterium]
MINVAIDAARAAGDLAYTYFGKTQNVRHKDDNSPVTIADIEAERLIRKVITKNFPSHGIIGEELENVNPNSIYQWTIDPVDGTKQFVRNIPYWATLLALLKEGKPILGVSYMPATGEIATAQKGKGAFLNGKKCKVSKISNLKNAYMCHSSIEYFGKKGKMNGFLKLEKTVYAARGYAETLGYHLLISGKIEIMLEAKDNIWDLAAPAILTEEAGGKFSDFSGKFSITSEEAIATNGLLHHQVVKMLNE